MAITLNGGGAASGVTATGTTTFTNKTINLTSNTLTGTIAQFNTAVSDADLATLAGSETLTNKTISGASNTLTVRLDQSDVTGTLVATKGGTAQSTYATGDTIYASASNTLSKLTVGSTGQVLTVAGGVPTWATPAAGTTANDQAFAFAVQVFA